jgi:hypothetical protein
MNTRITNKKGAKAATVSAPKSTLEKRVLSLNVGGRPNLGFVMDGNRMVALIVVDPVTDLQREMILNIAGHKEWRAQLTLASAWKMQAVYSSDAFLEASKDRILPRAIWMSWCH